MSSITNIWKIGTDNNGNGTNNNQFYISESTDVEKKLTIQRGTGIVGIGTNTNIFDAEKNIKLDINGSINLSGDIYKNGEIYVSDSTTWIENGEKIYYSSGKVGINTTEIDPNVLLEVNGTIKATNIIANGSQITNLNATNITTGTLDNNILPDVINVSYFEGSGAGITNINPASFNTGNINTIHLPDNITGKTYIGSGANITNLNASNIYIGTLSNDRMPADISVDSLSGDGSGITNLNPLAFSGNINNSQLPADISVTSFSGNGSGITNLNASNITSGKLNNSQLPDIISGKIFSGNGANITNLNASNFSFGKISNSIIPNNLTISGTFTSESLQVNGTTTYINTDIYQTSKLNITNTYNTELSLNIIHYPQTNVLNINDNNVRRFTITNAGNVGIGGIGFPNSSYKLDVEGNINSLGTISCQIVLIRDSINFYKSSTQNILIKIPQTLLSSYTITLPNAGPSANNILKSDSSGNLSWIDWENNNESLTLENIYTFFDNTEFEKTTNITSNITLKNINSSKILSAFNSAQFELPPIGEPQIISIKESLLTSPSNAGGNVNITSINEPPSVSVNNLNIVIDKQLTDEPTVSYYNYIEQITGMSGWTKIKHRPANDSTWFSGNTFDGTTINSSYTTGTPTNDNSQWAIAFDHTRVKYYLFIERTRLSFPDYYDRWYVFTADNIDNYVNYPNWIPAYKATGYPNGYANALQYNRGGIHTYDPNMGLGFPHTKISDGTTTTTLYSTDHAIYLEDSTTDWNGPPPAITEVYVKYTDDMPLTIPQPQITTDNYKYIILTYENAHPNYSSSIVNNQRLHTINFPDNVVADILIVGGGGGGDRVIGGGGGGGAVLYAKNIEIPSNTYTIKVGKGGNENQNGFSSEAFGAICLGGGSTPYVAWATPNNGVSGGSGSGASGGGGSTSTGGGVGISTKGSLLNNGILYNGNVGGNSPPQVTINGYYPTIGGGGGGAGGVGISFDSLLNTTRSKWLSAGRPGAGGDGIPIDILGTTYYWGAGGGGGSYQTHAGDGGLGGGGGGGSFGYPAFAGTNGYSYGTDGNVTIERGGNGGNGTGSGGGGGGYNGGNGNDGAGGAGGNGGSGIVIIRILSSIITHKYLELTYRPPPNLVYDFTNYNTETTWKEKAATIPNFTYSFDSWFGGSDGMWYSANNIGYIQYTLPSGYDKVTINYGNIYYQSYVRILINGVEKQSADANTFLKYTQKYNSGDILRIEEGFAIMTANLIITLENTTIPTTYQVNFPVNTTCDILIVGGGGGGARRMGGGGGAGALIYDTNVKLQGTYTINVGNGGLGNPISGNIRYLTSVGNSVESKRGDNGYDSEIIKNSTILYRAKGGGGGLGGVTTEVYEDPSSQNVLPGGSGGGSGGKDGAHGGLLSAENIVNGVVVNVLNNTYSKNTPNPSYDSTKCFGNEGGVGGGNDPWLGSGGGGAGGKGTDVYNLGSATANNTTGKGGDGKMINITGNQIYYAGGGGGGNWQTNGGEYYNDGGIGGGGRSGTFYAPPTSGINGTGGGGGGDGPDYYSGGNGGSGIVIIRYSMLFLASNVETENIIPKGYLKYDNGDWFIDEVNNNDYLSRNSLYNELALSRYLSNNNYCVINTYQYSVNNNDWYDIDKGDIIYISKTGYSGTYSEYKNNFTGNILFIKVKSCSLDNIYNQMNISSNNPYTTYAHVFSYIIPTISSTTMQSVNYYGGEQIIFSINLNSINLIVNFKNILAINLTTNYNALTDTVGTSRQQTDKFYLFYEEF